MKLIITGSRSFQEQEDKAWQSINFCMSHIPKPTHIISGTAAGIDRLGERYANLHDIELIRMPADWNKYGKSAGPIRNREMAKIADRALIIWDGVSPGSLNMVETMNSLGKFYYLKLLRI